MKLFPGAQLERGSEPSQYSDTSGLALCPGGQMNPQTPRRGAAHPAVEDFSLRQSAHPHPHRHAGSSSGPELPRPGRSSGERHHGFCQESVHSAHPCRLALRPPAAPEMGGCATAGGGHRGSEGPSPIRCCLAMPLWSHRGPPWSPPSRSPPPPPRAGRGLCSRGRPVLEFRTPALCGMSSDQTEPS